MVGTIKFYLGGVSQEKPLTFPVLKKNERLVAVSLLLLIVSVRIQTWLSIRRNRMFGVSAGPVVVLGHTFDWVCGRVHSGVSVS